MMREAPWENLGAVPRRVTAPRAGWSGELAPSPIRLRALTTNGSLEV